MSLQGNMRKNKVDRDEGRDISEKIALGMLKGTGGKLTGESLYDSRLFNQSSGMDAGFGGEDEYNTYTKPLFDRAEASSIYRPKQSAEDMYGDAEQQLKDLSDTSRFRADKGFKGAEQTAGGKRDAPVQFERAEGEGRANVDANRARDREREREREPPRRDSRDRDSRDDRRHDRDGDGYGRNSSSSSSRREHSRDRGSSRKEEEDPFGIRDIVDDGARKKSRRD